jgi:heat shock protein HslJ
MKKFITIFLLAIMAISNNHCSTGTMNTQSDGEQNAFQNEGNQDAVQNPKHEFQSKLISQGIDFYARGNEPFWSLDMDFEQNYQFKTMDGFQISVPPVIGSKAMDANVTRYFAEVESGTLIITIQEEKCQDTMSDEVFGFSARIQVKSGVQEEFTEYKGCGNFLPDLTLHDIWILEKINNLDLRPINQSQELPRFEFFSMEGKVLGHASCNEFNGKFSIVGQGEIQFDAITMTRKLCADMEIENVLGKAVFGRRMKYSRVESLLYLTGYDGTELVFKKVD